MHLVNRMLLQLHHICRRNHQTFADETTPQRITDIVTRNSTDTLVRGAKLQTHVILPFSFLFQPSY
jgi:hypothetical protein